MAKTAKELKESLVKAGHPVKEVEHGGQMVAKLKAPEGKPSKAWKAWRAAKAAQRRPPGVE